MAELILTEEEKKAPLFSDWSDETLGKAVKKAIFDMVDFSKLETDEEKNKVFFDKMAAYAAAKVLIANSYIYNSVNTVQNIGQMTMADKNIGDWKITVDYLGSGSPNKEVEEENKKDKLVLTEMKFELR